MPYTHSLGIFKIFVSRHVAFREGKMLTNAYKRSIAPGSPGDPTGSFEICLVCLLQNVYSNF